MGEEKTKLLLGLQTSFEKSFDLNIIEKMFVVCFNQKYGGC